ADEALDQRAEQRRRCQGGVLVGQAPGLERLANELFEFAGERLPIGGARGVDFGFDRFGQQREGEAAPLERARGEGGDRRRQRRQRPGRCLGGALERGHLARAKRRHERGDELGLGGEIAIDRAGGDTGTRGDRRNLNRRHAAFGRGVAGGRQDRIVAGGGLAGNVCRSAGGGFGSREEKNEA